MDKEVKDVVLEIRQMRKEQHLSYQDIVDLLEKQDVFLSYSTVKRIFSADLDKKGFNYWYSIRPIHKLLKNENIHEENTLITQVYEIKTMVDELYNSVLKC